MRRLHGIVYQLSSGSHLLADNLKHCRDFLLRIMSTPTSTILITGGTSGLGYQAALYIAKQQSNTQIILASRSNPDDAASTIFAATGHASVTFMALDLSSLSAVRSFVEAFTNAKYPPISALLLNAALQFPGKLNYTKDGYEATFGINHIGHALLFHLLYPQLAPSARIVFTASGTHDPAQKSGTPFPVYTNPEELARPSEAGGGLKTDGMVRYTTTKLCNVYWTYALQRRLEKDSRNSKPYRREDGGRDEIARSLTLRLQSK